MGVERDTECSYIALKRQLSAFIGKMSNWLIVKWIWIFLDKWAMKIHVIRFSLSILLEMRLMARPNRCDWQSNHYNSFIVLFLKRIMRNTGLLIVIMIPYLAISSYHLRLLWFHKLIWVAGDVCTIIAYEILYGKHSTISHLVVYWWCSTKSTRHSLHATYTIHNFKIRNFQLE